MTEPKSAADRIAFLEAELTSLRAITPSDRRIAEAPIAWAVKAPTGQKVLSVGAHYSIEAAMDAAKILFGENFHALATKGYRIYPVAVVEQEGECYGL